jgi:hypothetical protein
MNTSPVTPAPEEVAIVGRWLQTSDGVVADESCRRIESLVQCYLEHVAEHPQEGGWRTLFRDPGDGRMWERTYPDSQMHGGGPPLLRFIPAEEAKIEFKL